MTRTLSSFVCAVLSSLAINAFAAPQVIVTAAPNGMGQVGGGSLASDSFTLLNVGPGDATISLAKKGNFFNVSPASFTMTEGATQAVSIRSASQNNGVADGSVSVFITGVTAPIVVPIRLFVGSQPNGIVSPSASGAVSVQGLPNQIHSGAISVNNRGNVGMQGILVADVPWILPQANIIGIAPNGGRSQGPFDVDPSRRPDGDSPLGAIRGNISLVYLNGTANTTSSSAIAAAAPPSGRVSVSVLDFSKPPVAPGAPSPLAPGEIAVFLAGLTGRGGASTDLFLSNRTTTSISNLKLFYSAAAAPASSALLASVSALASNVTAWFPSAPQNIFNASNQIGTLQVRNPTAIDVSLAGLVTISPDLIANYLTALPVLRSDRGAASRLFSGIEKTPAVRHTNILVQETSGTSGTVTIDFFDANGNPAGAPRTESLPGFGVISLEDVAPAGALAAQITAGGGAKVDGFATVVDDFTLDSWIIVDPRAVGVTTGDDVMIAPIPAVNPSAALDFYVTGSGAVSLSGNGRRRHAVRSKSIGGGEETTAAANGTKKYTFAPGTAGYVRIAGGVGGFASSGRITISKSNGGSFGGAIPVRRAADGAAIGSTRRVSGIDDPLSGPHPALTLIESGGSSVTAKVTVRFTFNAGASTTGQITASKEYPLSAGQMVTVPDIVRTIVGAGRNTLGDLKRIVVDVDVTSGSGRVLPFVQTTDAGSGDVTVISD